MQDFLMMSGLISTELFHQFYCRFLTGFEFTGPPKFSWNHLKNRRDLSIKRLNNIYLDKLQHDGIKHFDALAKFIGKDEGGFKLQVSFAFWHTYCLKGS